MADEDRMHAIELTPAELKALTAKNLGALHEKFGIEVQIRSTRRAIDALLKDIGRDPMGPIAEFTRGFDRTSPGFDRYYNRDIPTMEFGETVIDPAELAALRQQLER